MKLLNTKKRFLSILQGLFLVISLCITSFSFTNFFTGPLIKISNIGYDKDVFLVKDACHKQFILKYNTKSSISTSETSIHEALGAKIGMAAGVPINDVRIFAPYDTSLGEVDCYPSICKTLHTLVPGKEVCRSEIPYKVHIQYTGPETLVSLTHHKDLCKIAALDLFTSNFDRHNGNIMFDHKNNRFYAIDMDWIFCDTYFIFGKNPHNYRDETPNKDSSTYLSSITPFLAKLKSALQGIPVIGKTALTHDLLAHRVYIFLKNMNQQIKLSAEEIEALKEINATLYILQTMYPPQKLYEEWMNIAKEAHYTYDPQKQEYIRYIIAYNNREITKIRSQINRLILDNTLASHTQHIKDLAAITYQNVAVKMYALHITLKHYQST